MNHELRVSLCHSITARALLAGAEAAEMEAQAMAPDVSTMESMLPLVRGYTAARRRYWREQAACEILHGRRWPEAEVLGGGAAGHCFHQSGGLKDAMA